MIKKLISDLTNEKIKISIALRKCRLLQSSISDTELDDFISNETNDYPWDKTPDYRILTGSPKAQYRNQLNGQRITVPLNFSELSDAIGADFNERKVPVSIIEIEDLLNQSSDDVKSGEIQQMFTDDQFKLVYQNTSAGNNNGWILESAWWTFPINTYRKIYSKTIDRLIEVLIRIDREHPSLNSDLSETKDDELLEDSKESNSITNHFHGDVKGSAMGFGKNSTQKDITINYNDEIDRLIEKITELGFDSDDSKDLKNIIVEQERSNVPVGKQILAWIGKMTSKAIEKGIEHKIPELTDMVSGYIN